MGSHIVDGEFQSDTYPTTPPGKVPLSVKDRADDGETLGSILWEAKRRDAETRGAYYMPWSDIAEATREEHRRAALAVAEHVRRTER